MWAASKRLQVAAAVKLSPLYVVVATFKQSPTLMAALMPSGTPSTSKFRFPTIQSINLS
jgi:hypothetical protein